MANGSHQILSFKTRVISTILFLFSTALLLKLTIPGSREVATSVVPQVRSISLLSQLKTFYPFLIINALVVAIAASSGLHHQAQDPWEIRRDPGVLDADADGPPHAEEEEEEEEEEDTGSFEVKVADPSMLSEAPVDIRVDPNSLDATAYGEMEEQHFADCKSDWVMELRDPTERPVVGIQVGNGKSMKVGSQERKALEMMRPTSNETLESVWKRIMENSNNSDTSDHPQPDLISIQRSSVSPFLNSQKPRNRFQGSHHRVGRVESASTRVYQ